MNDQSQLVEEELLDDKPKAFLVRNIIQQDGFSLSCWCKCVFGVWPVSTQYSHPDKEMAVVKLPYEPQQQGNS